MPVGRLGVREVGLRLVRLSVGQIQKKRQTRNMCPNPETCVQNQKLLSRSGNVGQNRKHRLVPEIGNQKPGRHRVRKEGVDLLNVQREEDLPND